MFGTGSFSRVDDGGGDWPATWRSFASKKKTTATTTTTTKIISEEKNKKKKKKKEKEKEKEKNPYAGRGLDKFDALLADLDARKQKIKSAGDSFQAIWFKYSSSHDWIPLVVKLPAEPWGTDGEEEKKKKNNKNKKRSLCGDVGQAPAKQKTMEVPREAAATVPAVAPVEEEEERGRGGRYHNLFWSTEVVLVLILLCLAMAGRSFAICCTILWWYFVPVGGGRRKKKKETTTAAAYQRRTMSLDRPAVPRQQNAIIRRGTSYESALSA